MDGRTEEMSGRGNTISMSGPPGRSVRSCAQMGSLAKDALGAVAGVLGGFMCPLPVTKSESYAGSKFERDRRREDGGSPVQLSRS